MEALLDNIRVGKPEGGVEDFWMRLVMMLRLL